MKFLSYINGVSYVFEGFMVNEFTYAMACAPAQIVPFNEARDPNYQSCTIPGNRAGSLSVEGSDYLQASFGYSHAHLWRNVGVVIAFTVLYLIPTIIASEFLPFAGGGGGFTIFAATKNAKRAAKQVEARKDDPEANAVHGRGAGNQLDLASSNSERTARSEMGDERKSKKDLDQRPVFAWRDVHYTVDGHHLLNGIDGYVKPGEMTVRPCFTV